MKRLIVGNWKANPQTQKQAEKIFKRVAKEIRMNKKTEVVICPPFVYLILLRKTQQKLQRKIKLGAQNLFFEKGAYTGEISPLMLKNIGCKYVIVGHSERRKLGEGDELINKKIKAALISKIIPILCIGEGLKERERGLTFQIIKNQLLKGLYNIPKNQLEKITIAYEPVWSIGTGKACMPNKVLEVVIFIRKILKERLKIEGFKKIRILYGGSVSSKNALLYLKEKNINGLLVGGASLKPQEFLKIINLA